MCFRKDYKHHCEEYNTEKSSPPNIKYKRNVWHNLDWFTARKRRALEQILVKYLIEAIEKPLRNDQNSSNRDRYPAGNERKSLNSSRVDVKRRMHWTP